MTVHRLPIEPSVGASLRDLVATHDATGENVLTVMRQAYVAYALEWSHRYRAIFTLLGDEAALPLLLHCSAGKDRTGFGSALILTALGVPREVVREDYLASNRLWRGGGEVAAGLPEPVAGDLAAGAWGVAGCGVRGDRGGVWGVRAVCGGDVGGGCGGGGAVADEIAGMT